MTVMGLGEQSRYQNESKADTGRFWFFSTPLDLLKDRTRKYIMQTFFYQQNAKVSLESPAAAVWSLCETLNILRKGEQNLSH